MLFHLKRWVPLGVLCHNGAVISSLAMMLISWFQPFPIASGYLPPPSLSDSESGGCLHPIGPPSSVDNLSDDYLHPVASSLERATAAHLTGAAADQPPVTNVSSMLAASELESHYQNASCVLTAPKPERCCQNACRRFTQPETEPHYQIPKH